MCLEPHLPSGWPQTNPNFIFTTKMVFPKSFKFMNSGSEELTALWCHESCLFSGEGRSRSRVVPPPVGS